jgi:hypothetical protein
MLANAALFMWQYHDGALTPGNARSETSAGDYSEKILLVSELNSKKPRDVQFLVKQEAKNTGLISASDALKPDEKKLENLVSSPDSTSEATEDAGAKAEVIFQESENENRRGNSCLEIGPFTYEREMNAWKRLLNGNIKVIARDEPVVKDYLVYYPAAENLLQSQDNLKMLKEKGIRDLWLFTEGQDQGQISFGVFDKEARALKMQNELLVKDINAAIKARLKNKMQKYALVKTDNRINEAIQGFAKAYPKIRVKQLVDAAAQQCFEGVE